MTRRKTKRPAPARDSARDRVHRKLLLWWAQSFATIEEICRVAHNIADAVADPRSAHYGLLDHIDVRDLARTLGEAATAFADAVPLPRVSVADPLAEDRTFPRRAAV